MKLIRLYVSSDPGFEIRNGLLAAATAKEKTAEMTNRQLGPAPIGRSGVEKESGTYFVL
jgi:hypothetical protein